MSRIIKFAAVHETPFVITAPRSNKWAEKKADNLVSTESDVAKLEAELGVKKCIEQARQDASVITQLAHEEAASIIAQASVQVEQLRQEAIDDGVRQGYDEGLAQGHEAGLSQMTEAIDDAIQRAQLIIEAAENEAKRNLVQAERQIVEIAITIAGKILFREIDENPMVLLPIVKAALDKVCDQEKITVRVNPEEYSLVLEAKPELSTALKVCAAISIIADDSLKVGDCIVETPYGNVDARIDSQLEVLTAALRDAMP
ncbi:MAG: Flagellar assembly protein FliH/Type secretion system HrpE [Firmicutes bacterium]|nr:Flagellar assembly protein FliH/Type secretion system HrpE [Bacillota bacterium]